MPHTPIDFQFQKAVTSAADGKVFANAQGMRYALGAGVNRNLYPWYAKLRLIAYDTSNGGIVTFLVQDSPDDVTYTTRVTKALTIASLQTTFGLLFKTSNPYLRVRISALSGGTTPTGSVYGTIGTYGV